MSKNVYEMISERIIEMIDTEGQLPWKKPWSGSSKAWSRATGRPYSILNQLYLPAGEYVTFKQAQAEGGHIVKGAKGYPVTFFKVTEIEEENPDTGKKEKRKVPLLRYYIVFRVGDQTEGLEQKYNREELQNRNEPIEELEAIKNDYLAREKVGFRNIVSSRAYYSPIDDSITLPKLEQFDSIEEYYSTAFHEIGHSTGHSSRLNRIKVLAAFGTEEYSKEELTAELTAAAIMSETGLETAGTFRNSAAYIKGWRDAIAQDNRLIVHAASKSQKAYEMIMNL